MLTISEIEEQFDARAYLRALASIAQVDGVLEVERQFIEQQALSLGLNPSEIDWTKAADLDGEIACASGVTRRLIVRDCIVLASLDDDYTDNERREIRQLAARLGISDDVVHRLEDWVVRYSAIIEEGRELLAM